ncbi:hypothetical protein JCM11251_005997 [Rhodosporidiobolus azoricus]
MSSDSEESEQPTSTRRTSSKREQRRAALDRLKQTKAASSTRAQPTFLGADDDDGDEVNFFDGLDAVRGGKERTRKRPSAAAEEAPRRGRDSLLDNAFDDLFDLGDAAPADGTDVAGVIGAAEDLDVEGAPTKKRRVVAKLDETRLLGPTGFPKLRQELKKVKIKGKGHELQDLRRVLTLYQLWTHELFPRTNLRDTLTTVEKLCHKRSVQRELKTYRDLEKSGKLAQDDASLTTADDLFGDLVPFGSGARAAAVPSAGSARGAGTGNGKGKEKEKEVNTGDDEDDFGFDAAEEEAILAELEREATQAQAQPQLAGAAEERPKEKEKERRLVFEEDEDMFGAEEDILAELEREATAAVAGKAAEKTEQRMSFEEDEEFNVGGSGRGGGDDAAAEEEDEDVLREMETQEREAMSSKERNGAAGQMTETERDPEKEKEKEVEREMVQEKRFEVTMDEDEEAEAALREAEELLGF